MSAIVFPEGEFYSCSDPESLSCVTPEEAIEEWLDGLAPGDILEDIRKYAPVTVTAYKPTEIADAEIDQWADDLLETLAEKWGEEHADPDSDPAHAFPADATTIMREAARKIIRSARVWSCESVGSVKLDAAQVEAAMRAYRPDWFKGVATAALAPSAPNEKTP